MMLLDGCFTSLLSSCHDRASLMKHFISHEATDCIQAQRKEMPSFGMIMIA